MQTVNLLNIPIFYNINRNITFFINNVSINLIQKNYSLQEILNILYNADNNFLYDSNLNKLYSIQFINLRFTNSQDRDYILTFLGYVNYLENIRNDLNIALKGCAKYSININFNNIVKLTLNNTNETFYIETGAFSYSSIIRLLTNQTTIISYKFMNIYTKESKNIVIKSNMNRIIKKLEK